MSWTSDPSGSAGDGSQDGVFARRFDASGNPVSGEIQVNEETSGNQFAPTVTGLADGSFVVAWASATSGSAGDGDFLGVFQRLFGDETLFTPPSADPAIEAISAERSFTESEIETPQRLDLDGAAAVSDPDSANFDGGQLFLSLLSRSGLDDRFSNQDADGQNVFGLLTGGRIAISSSDVSVDGTVVAMIALRRHWRHAPDPQSERERHG